MEVRSLISASSLAFALVIATISPAHAEFALPSPPPPQAGLPIFPVEDPNPKILAALRENYRKEAAQFQCSDCLKGIDDWTVSEAECSNVVGHSPGFTCYFRFSVRSDLRGSILERQFRIENGELKILTLN
ncbi:MAG: hypothetical protein J0I28_08580 [Caulobacterales bacterium]|nr:hypothetical protein [Caulobacterales bacterium]